MKSIARDIETLDAYARNLWGQESRGINKINGFPDTYYASTTSYNWFGFLERINECIESPTWFQVNSFVKYYCNKRGVEFSSYILLYNNLEEMGYSSMFKTTNMKDLYLSTTDCKNTLDPFYQQIIDFFNSESEK